MIHNIRLGHACNSSSTHSIVPAANLHGGRDASAYEGEYGWGWFELLGEQEKMHYLAVLLAGQLPDAEIAEITGFTPTEADYVDHQSHRAMPSTYRAEFVRDLADWLRRPDVAIRGGNDNDDAPYEAPAFDFPIGREFREPLARPDIDPNGNRYWVVYYLASGDKVRFSFDRIPVRGEESWDQADKQGSAVAYGSLPELVDLKVTAFCPFEKDCPWCYMDSTTKGQPASKAGVARALKACEEAGVFEIAIGGGEPTLWPHLDWLTKAAQKAGITLNMTTKNFAWLKGKANRETLGRLGAIAVSVNNPRDLERFQKFYAAHGPNGTVSHILTHRRYSWGGEDEKTEITLQCIPALLSDELVTQIVDFCAEESLRITFLGLKRTGRAEASTEAEDLRWIDALKGRSNWWLQSSVAVDTIMAAQAKTRFEAAGIDPVFYGVDEGAFSCYIDAVAGLLGPSSYAPVGQMEKFGKGDDLGTVFRHTQRLAGIRGDAA